MMSPSPFQLLIVVCIALLLFGNRLPEIMRSLGRSVVEFKKGVNGIEEEVSNAINGNDDNKPDEE